LRLEVDEPGSRVAVAIDDDGAIIGLAAAGVSCDEDAPTGWELYSINVLADQQGTGLADDLMAATAGEANATVWVVADNERAQAFYRRNGFTREGATRSAEIGGAPEMRMVRRSGVPER
jgi:ribosomal protein S18 acetylase RimI-like enzyme